MCCLELNYTIRVELLIYVALHYHNRMWCQHSNSLFSMGWIYIDHTQIIFVKL